MKAETRNTTIGVLLTTALVAALTLGAAAPTFAQDRLALRPGETNWVPPEFERGERAVITVQDLNAPGVTPATMVQNLLGLPMAGVTVSNETFNGLAVGPWASPRAGGLFAGGGSVPCDPDNGPIGILDGVILSSGNIHSVPGGPRGTCNTSDSTSTNNGEPGDADLNAIVAPQVTHDRAILSFDIICYGPRVLMIEYVFASEEYNEWAFTGYNDVCAIFIWGPGTGNPSNLALVPPGGGGPAWVPVTINNVNGGNPYMSGNQVNPNHYCNNDCGDGGLPPYPCAPLNVETEMDGLTKDDFLNRVFQSVPFLLNTGVTYTVALVVADTKDSVWDSNLFAKGTLDLGACCVGGGDYCTTLPEDDCINLGGVWTSGQLCSGISCGITGACCLPAGPCYETWDQLCSEAGGTYLGDGTACGPLGACYVSSGCIITSEACCTAAGGSWAGSGSECLALGACCLPDGACIPDLTESECVGQGGSFEGVGTLCVAGACPVHPPIPTLSEWGLIVFTLLLLTGGTIVLGRQRRRRPQVA